MHAKKGVLITRFPNNIVLPPRDTQPLSSINQKNFDKDIHVLMVDDEKDQLTLAKLNLENSDPRINVTAAQSPAEAITLLQTHRPDCIVSDYSMPEMTGIQLHSTIMEQDIPYILYTSRGGDEVAKEAFSVGIDDYVRKDASLAHYDFLARRIQVAVDKKRSESWYLTYSKKKYLNCRIWSA